MPVLTPLRRNLSVIGVLLATLMATLDASIVNVALPTIARELHESGAATVWVTTAFLVATACAVPTTAALGDVIGRRRLFLIGVPLFTIASVGCALAPTLGLLIAARVLQGVGSACTISVAIPLFRRIFPPERLGSILGINAMTVAIGICAGPALGGLILAGLDWPWLFLINVPVGVLSFAIAAINLPRVPPQVRRFDLPGGVLAAGAVAALILGIHQLTETSTLGWGVGLLVVAAALITAFLRVEKRAEHPLIPLGLFTPRFDLAVVTAFWSFFGQGVAFVALPFLFQSAYGATPLESALLFTPWPLAIVVIAPLSGRLADRIRPALLAVVGLTVFTLGLVSLALLGAHPQPWEVLVRTAVTGAGFAIFQSPNNRDMMSAAPLEHSASAAGVLNLNRNIGQSTGSAAVSMALIVAGGAVSSAQQASAAGAVLWIAVAGAAVSIVVSVVKLAAGRPDAAGAPEPSRS